MVAVKVAVNTAVKAVNDLAVLAVCWCRQVYKERVTKIDYRGIEGKEATDQTGDGVLFGNQSGGAK